MNIEQKTDMQVLKPQYYTKVYGGNTSHSPALKVLFVNPIGPIKPKKPGADDD